MVTVDEARDLYRKASELMDEVEHAANVEDNVGRSVDVEHPITGEPIQTNVSQADANQAVDTAEQELDEFRQLVNEVDLGRVEV